MKGRVVREGFRENERLVQPRVRAGESETKRERVEGVAIPASDAIAPAPKKTAKATAAKMRVAVALRWMQ